MSGNLPENKNKFMDVMKAVLGKLQSAFLKQQVAHTIFYQVKTEQIPVLQTVQASLNIGGDSDFLSERLFIVFDKAFSAANFTIIMNMVDSGSGRIITRNDVDLRAIANPGLFDVGGVIAGYYVTGIGFKYVFRKNSTLKFTFQNTDTANTHGVTIVLQGKAVESWERIPHSLG
jgi:hypothetical protein